MFVTIKATKEEIENKAKRLAREFWDYGFNELNAFVLIKIIFPELTQHPAFEDAYKAEWSRLWNE